MIALNTQKTANAASVLAVAGAIAWPDMAFGLTAILFHHLLELFHLGFECFESGLDHLVEHICRTEGHTTQIIVFYLMLAMAGGIACYLWKTMPRMLDRLRACAKAAWLERRARLTAYWQTQSRVNKIKLLAWVNGGLACLALLNF